MVREKTNRSNSGFKHLEPMKTAKKLDNPNSNDLDKFKTISCAHKTATSQKYNAFTRLISINFVDTKMVLKMCQTNSHVLLGNIFHTFNRPKHPGKQKYSLVNSRPAKYRPHRSTQEPTSDPPLAKVADVTCPTGGTQLNRWTGCNLRAKMYFRRPKSSACLAHERLIMPKRRTSFLPSCNKWVAHVRAATPRQRVNTAPPPTPLLHGHEDTNMR